MNIGTWNVRTQERMLRAGNLEEMKNIMIQKNIGLLGLCKRPITFNQKMK